VQKIKRKVPHPYSRADKSARSLTGIRDDERFGSNGNPEIAPSWTGFGMKTFRR